jgi:hypothetical protein
MEQRPLIEFPKWDGKLVLAGIFIIGYYSLVLIMAWRPLPTTNAGLIRDAMLTLGPVVGLIFGSLFRTTGAEERNAALRSADLQAVAAATPALPEPEKVAAAVEVGVRKGLANAEPVQVETAPMAADGEHRDWLDGPDRDPWTKQ